MPQGIGYGMGGPSGSPDAAGVGIAEPSAAPGALGDIDSLLANLMSGQVSAESILPLLFMLMLGGGQGAPTGPVPSGDPITDAFAPQPEGPQAGSEADILAMLGGGGF